MTHEELKEHTYQELKHRELAKKFAEDMVDGMDIECLAALAIERLTIAYEKYPHEVLIAEIKNHDAEYLLGE